MRTAARLCIPTRLPDHGLCTKSAYSLPFQGSCPTLPTSRRCISGVPFDRLRAGPQTRAKGGAVPLRQAQGRQDRHFGTPSAYSQGEKLNAPFPPARPQAGLLGVPPSPTPRGLAPLEPPKADFSGVWPCRLAHARSQLFLPSVRTGASVTTGVPGEGVCTKSAHGLPSQGSCPTRPPEGVFLGFPSTRASTSSAQAPGLRSSAHPMPHQPARRCPPVWRGLFPAPANRRR